MLLLVTLVFVAVLLLAFALDALVIRPLEGRRAAGSRGHQDPPVELTVPRTLFFHPAHTWVRLEEDGTVTVGVDDLLRTLVGDLSSVELPAVGDRVAAGRPAMVVRGEGRSLRVPAPVSGRIAEVNRQLGSDPARLRWRPYKEGWAFRLVPGDRLSAELGALAIGRDAERWMALEIQRVDGLFDHGLLEAPLEGAVGRGNASAWAAFEREILGVGGPSAEAGA